MVDADGDVPAEELDQVEGLGGEVLAFVDEHEVVEWAVCMTLEMFAHLRADSGEVHRVAFAVLWETG